LIDDRLQPLNVPCPKCSENNNNLIISGTESEIYGLARNGTLQGWCHIHDTVRVPSEVQREIAAGGGES
jgi:hypothetical protein